MHVLISAISRFTSPTGICRHAANLAACLESRPEIDRVTLVRGEWQSYYRDLVGIQSPKLSLVPIKLRNDSISRNRWFMGGLPAFAKSQGADVVHLSFPIPIRRTDAYKTVVTLHDLYPYDCPEVFGYPNVFFNRLFLRNCLKNVDGIACVSDATQSRLGSLFSSNVVRKSRVIPNIIRRASSLRQQRPQNWPETPFVLVVAQHRRNKNLGLAIKAFSELHRRSMLHGDTRFVLVGTEGPDSESMKRAIREEGLERRTTLISSLHESQLNWLYANALFLLITSTVEGFCLPLLEALRFSCPVVCSDIPILREVGTAECHYFSLSGLSLESLVATVGRALDSPRPKGGGLERYSSYKAATAYSKFYASLSAAPLVEAKVLAPRISKNQRSQDHKSMKVS